MLELLKKGPATIGSLLQSLHARNPDRLRRTVSWLLKLGIVRLV